MAELDREEREILEAYRRRRLQPIDLSEEDIEAYRDAARAANREMPRGGAPG